MFFNRIFYRIIFVENCFCRDFLFSSVRGGVLWALKAGHAGAVFWKRV